MKKLILSSLVLAAVLILSRPAGAQITVNSDVTTNTTWTVSDSPVTVVDTLNIVSGVTLTIEPAVQVHMSAGASMVVDGALVADGTETDRVTFTSAQGTPAAGDWNSIVFNNTTDAGSVINYVLFEYGGGGSRGAIIAYRTGAYSVGISNSTIRRSAGHGIDLRASSPLLFKSTFVENAGYGIFSDLSLNYEVDSSTVRHNTTGGIRVPINASPVITASDIDSNGTGIFMDNGATPTVRFNNIRENTTGIRVIETGSTSPVISDNTISGNSTIGVRNEGSGGLVADYNFWGAASGPNHPGNPNGTGDLVGDNIDYEPWLFGAVLPVREITDSPVNGDIWYADTVYYVRNNIGLAMGNTLTIQPGAVIKFDDDVTFDINGTLIADGTAADKIYFTSRYDDAIGGDSNGDGRATQPSRGDWRRLNINSESANSVLDHVDLRYGGYSQGMLRLEDPTVSVTNTVATNSYDDGIYIQTRPAAFNNITANKNRRNGVLVYNQGSELESVNASYNGDNGIAVNLNGISENLSIHNSSATHNSEHGIHFYSGAGNRSYGLDSLTNSVVSDNRSYGLQLEENGVGRFYMYGNTFERNAHYGASVFLNDAFIGDNHIEGNVFGSNGLAGLRTTSARIFSNTFTSNQVGLTLWGELSHRYSSAGGVDGNTFVDNTFNNVLGLHGRRLTDTLSTNMPAAITSGAYLYQRISHSTPHSAVSANDTLIIAPGVIIKTGFSGYASNGFGTHDGTIIAEGTASEPIVFTSWRDDSWGGDTDAPGDTMSASTDDWDGLYLLDRYNDNNGTVKHSRLGHVIIRYADTGLDMDLGNQTLADVIDHITISHSYNRGAYLDYGNYTFDHALIEHTRRYDGIEAYNNANVIVRNSSIRNNGRHGLNARGSSDSFFQEVSNSVIEANGDDGIYTHDLRHSSTILGNTIQDNGNNGIYAFHTALDSTDLYFTGNTIRNNVHHGIVASASIFIDNIIEANEFPISLAGKLGHRYTDENGVDGNQFVDNKFNNVLGLYGRELQGTLTPNFPVAVTSGVHLFQRISYGTPHSAVDANDTLIIRPGVIIKAGYGGYSNNQFGTHDGTIIAEGTASDPIVFTSWRDDSWGGDTDAVDDTLSAATDDWGGLYVLDRYNDNNGTAKHSSLGHIIIRHADRGLDMDMGNQVFEDEINDVTIYNANDYGAILEYGKYVLNNFLVEQTHRYDGIYSYQHGDIIVRNSLIQDNSRYGLYARGSNDSFLREVSNSVIRNNGDDGIHVPGGKYPMTYQFNTISHNNGNGIMTYQENVGTDTVLTISGNNILHNGGIGILSSRAIIVDDTLEYNDAPLGLTGTLSKHGTVNDQGNYYEGNVIRNNELDSVLVVTGTIRGILGGTFPAGYQRPLVVARSDIELNSADSLIFVAGTILKNQQNVDFDLEGHVESRGSLDSKVVFTAFTDDTYGGNTNGDSTGVQPAPGDWAGINLSTPGSDSSKIVNTIIRYAYTNLDLNNTEVLVDSSFISYARNYGIYINNGANPAIRSSDIHHNRHGIYINGYNSPDPVIHLNNITDNTDNGLYKTGSHTVTAANNYWGHHTGPFVETGPDLNLQGEGNEINVQDGEVVYRPFLTSRNGLLLGDITQNGVISAFDASQVLQYVVSLITFSPEQAAVADVSGNGSVSAMDASYILQFVVGNISGFPGQGKRVVPDFEDAFTLDIQPQEAYTDVKMQLLGGQAILANQMRLIVPGGAVDRVELYSSDFKENLTMSHSLRGDTVSIALAGDRRLSKAGELATYRLHHKEGKTISDLKFARFMLNETDLTQFVERTYTSVIDEKLAGIPDVFSVSQNYPNPFNPTTTVRYDLPQNGEVTVRVFNVLGQMVATLVDQKQQAGRYDVRFNAMALSSGTYFLRIDFRTEGNESFTELRKMMLIK